MDELLLVLRSVNILFSGVLIGGTVIELVAILPLIRDSARSTARARCASPRRGRSERSRCWG